MRRWWWRDGSVALLRIAIPSYCLLLIIPRLAVAGRPLSMLLQDRALELRGSTEAIEAISFSEIRLDGCLDPVDRAILAARVG